MTAGAHTHQQRWIGKRNTRRERTCTSNINCHLHLHLHLQLREHATMVPDLTLRSERPDSSQRHASSKRLQRRHTTTADRLPTRPPRSPSPWREAHILTGEPSLDLLEHMYIHDSMLVRTRHPTPARVWHESTHGEIPFYGPSRYTTARLLDSRYQDALRAIAAGNGPSPRMSSRPAVASGYVSALGHLSHLVPTDEAYTAELTSLKRGQVSDRLQPPGRPRRQKRSPIAGGNVILLWGGHPQFANPAYWWAQENDNLPRPRNPSDDSPRPSETNLFQPRGAGDRHGR